MVQVNLADSVYAEDKEDLSKDMGEHFGKKHRNTGDSVGHWTTLISNADCPSDYNPGCFYLPIAQVFVASLLILAGLLLHLLDIVENCMVDDRH